MSGGRPRILHVITRAEPGGAQAHLLDVVRAVSDRFELAVAVGEQGFLTEQLASLGIQATVIAELVQPVRPRHDLAAAGKILKLIRSIKPALVHAHSSKAGLLARYAAWRAGVPAVYTSHGWAFADGVSRRRLLIAVPPERLAAKWCSRIITVCEADKAIALRYKIADPARFTVIHNGVTDTPERAHPARSDEPRIIMVARFAAQKDHRLLIDAAAGVTGKFRLILVGDGPLRAAEEARVRDLQMSGRVEFLGWRTDMAALLASSHLFVLASHWEGFPISILEAMRAGLPVIASNVGGVGEAVAEGETGFIIPRGDAALMRSRLQLLVSDAAMRARLGAAGRRRYEQNFTVEQMAAKLFTLYEELLASPAQAPGRIESLT